MKILETRILRGPNVHSARPCFYAVLDLEELDDRPSSSFPGFTDRLIELLPDITSHRCSMGYRGGFVDRLREGTYPAHITEHVLIELQCMAGTDVGYGKARMVPNRPRQFTIVCSYKIEKVVKEALPVAIKIVEGLAKGEPVDIAEDLENLRYWVQRMSLGPSTNAIVSAAERRGIPTFRLTEEASLFQLGWGKHQHRIQASTTSNTNYIAVGIASDKELTNALLAEAGLPVPRGEVVRSPERAVTVARRLGGPAALKPFDGNQGKGVSLNLTDPEQIMAAYALAANWSRSVLVEQYIKGRDYRVLVVKNQVVAAACRLPAQVQGDGVSTVTQLVEKENRNPRRGVGHMKPMTLIKLDEASRQVLERQGLSFESVPEKGKAVLLKENANLSTGGSAEDVTDLLHPRNAAFCVRAAQKIGLDVAGIDVVCDDISVPLDEQGGALIEVNAAPGIRMHQHPSKGEPHDVGAAIVASLFPEGARSRVPIVAVTGTNGKTTVTTAINHVISNLGVTTGMTTTEGIYVDGERLQTGDCTGYWSARTVLTDPNVEFAVLETARGGLFKRGLAFDACDVGVVLNIRDDHLGQHGAETLKDLARVKGLIARFASKAIVLNAMDPLCVAMAEEKMDSAEVIYFSMDADNEVLVRHLDGGGRGVYLRRNMIMLGRGDHRIPLIEVEKLPFTLHGRARFNVDNSLATIGALIAAGFANEQVVRGLSSYTSSVDQNPGRMNLFRVRDFFVMLDYAHNADSYRQIVELGRQLEHKRLIGVITAPGDRYPDKLREIGRICGDGFDELIVREMTDLRGRPAGEAAGIIMEGVRESKIPMEKVKLVLEEVNAINAGIDMAQKGDLVIIGCSDTLDAIDAVTQHAETLIAPKLMRREGGASGTGPIAGSSGTSSGSPQANA